MTRAMLLAAFCTAGLAASGAARAGCDQIRPLELRVRFAGEAPRTVLLESLQPSGLRLRDPVSGDQLWSAGPDASHTQQVAGMTASFGTSLAAVHLDADGLHDRIYAADRAGRVWRLDLRAGARRSSWLQAWMLADLGAADGGRGFVARPDITRIDAASGSWLNIAIGTANTAAPRHDHRFYVLRDALATPPEITMHEADLERLAPPAGAEAGNTHGYFLLLGSAQVLAQALTLDGRIHFTTVEAPRNLIAACPADALPDDDAPLTVTVLRARDGEVAEVQRPDGAIFMLRRPVAGPLPASTGVQLAAAAPDSASTAGILPCTIGSELLAGCALDTRPRRKWWRREDAD